MCAGGNGGVEKAWIEERRGGKKIRRERRGGGVTRSRGEGEKGEGWRGWLHAKGQGFAGKPGGMGLGLGQ